MPDQNGAPIERGSQVIFIGIECEPVRCSLFMVLLPALLNSTLSSEMHPNDEEEMPHKAVHRWTTNLNLKLAQQ